MVGQLVRKELHMQKSNGWFALVVLLFWVALMAAAPFGDKRIHNLYGVQMVELLRFLQTGFVGVCLAFVLPMAIGATLAAEERNAGVWDWTLSLPGSRKKQWLVKVATGMFLTAVLAWGVLPLADTVLYAALSHPNGVHIGGAQRGLFATLQRSACLLLLPMVFFASGAFASSLVSRPYKAFFLAIPIAAIALGAARLTDLGSLLGIPWSDKELAKSGLNAMARFYAILHVVVTVGLLLGLAYLNFRFDHFRKRRLAFELVTLILAVAVVCGALVHLAISPLPLLSNRWEDAAPGIAESSVRQWGVDLPPLDRERIAPLVVARQNPPWWTGSARFTENLGIAIPNQPDAGDPDVRYAQLRRRGGIMGQTLRLNVRTGETRWVHSLLGIVGPQPLPFVLSRVSPTHVPLLDEIRAHREWQRQMNEAPVWNAEVIEMRTETGKTLTVHNAQRLSDSLDYYAGVVKRSYWTRLPNKKRRKDTRETRILARREGDLWRILTRGDRPAVSPDGKWFIGWWRRSAPRRWKPGAQKAQPNLQIVSTDGTATRTLGGGRRVRLLAWWPGYRFADNPPPQGTRIPPWDPQPYQRPPLPSVPSAHTFDKRYVLYYCVHEPAEEKSDGWVYRSYIPEKLTFHALDLETGECGELLKLKPESLVFRWHWASCLEGYRGYIAGSNPTQPSPRRVEDFLRVRRAPDRQRYAILFDGRLTVLDAPPDPPETHIGPVLPLGFRKVRQLDISALIGPLEISSSSIDFHFLDDSTILLWNGRIGVFRVDLEK